MVQTCWNKGPLGPTVRSGCFVLAFFNEEDEVVKELKERFGAAVASARDSPDLDDIPYERALVWCWD